MQDQTTPAARPHATILAGPGGQTTLLIDTSQAAGRAAMLAGIRASQRAAFLKSAEGRLRSALDSHRKTQRTFRLGMDPGYFAKPATSRQWVRQMLAELRAKRAEWEARR